MKCPKCGKIKNGVNLDYPSHYQKLSFCIDCCNEIGRDRILFACEGDKVIADELDNGSRCDSEWAHKHLTQDEIYTVDEICIGGCSTEIMLKEIPNIYFNSVHFNVCNQ